MKNHLPQRITFVKHPSIMAVVKIKKSTMQLHDIFVIFLQILWSRIKT